MLEILGGICVLSVMVLLSGLKTIKDYERLVVFRFGKVTADLGPGLRLIVPIIDHPQLMDMRVTTCAVPLMEATTSDHFSVKISALCFFQVVNARKAIMKIDNENKATTQLAEIILRTEVGHHGLTHMISERKRINHILKADLNKQVADFGIRVTRFEIKELRIPRAMQKLMARTKLHKLQLEHPLNRPTYKVDLENLGQSMPFHRVNN